MRLQLTSALAAVLGARVAIAEPTEQPGASATLRVYTDDDHVTVVSPSGSVRAAVTPDTSLMADVTVDAVSAASVDVVTSASPRTVEEQREEVGLAGTYRLAHDTTWFTVGVRGSHEHDYDSIRARLGARRELAQRNTTLDVTYAIGEDVARSVVDDAFRATRTSHELMLVTSQLLAPRTVADLIVDASVAWGYHASPYRQVLVDQMSSPIALRVSEQTPDRRASIALAARLRQALAYRLFASATYRYYRDDWQIASHTGTAELLRPTASRWLVGGLLRGYVQDRAEFYRARYDDADGVPRFRTRDRTLGAMRSAHAALTVDVALDDDHAWHVIGSVGVMRMWFLDFPAQANRDALIVHAGVSSSW